VNSFPRSTVYFARGESISFYPIFLFFYFLHFSFPVILFSCFLHSSFCYGNSCITIVCCLCLTFYPNLVYSLLYVHLSSLVCLYFFFFTFVIFFFLLFNSVFLFCFFSSYL